MKIDALALHATSGWPELGTDALAPGLNVFHGPSASGKTTLADLVTHAIYGRRFALKSADGEHAAAPQGEVIVEHRGKQYRLRRSHDETAGERLTVAALDQSAVDQETVRQLVACLSPTLLAAAVCGELPRITAARLAAVAGVLARVSRHAVAAQMGAADRRSRAASDLRPAAGTGDASGDARPRSGHGRGTRGGRRQGRSRTRSRRASHFLARLTDGELVRLRLGREAGEAHVVTRRRRFDPRGVALVDAARSGLPEPVPVAWCRRWAGTVCDCRWCSTSHSRAWTPRRRRRSWRRLERFLRLAATRCWCSPPSTEAAERSRRALGAKVHDDRRRCASSTLSVTQQSPLQSLRTSIPRRVRRRVKTSRDEAPRSG